MSIKKYLNTLTNRHFFVVTIALGVLACGLLATTVLLQRARPHTPTTYKALSLGTTVNAGVASITLDNVSSSPGGGPYTAPAGSHFVIGRLTIRNNGSTPIYVAPAADTYLKSAEGDVVFLSPTALDAPLRSGQLLPGETIRGQLSYLVKDAATYQLYVESDWSGGVCSFLLH